MLKNETTTKSSQKRNEKGELLVCADAKTYQIPSKTFWFENENEMKLANYIKVVQAKDLLNLKHKLIVQSQRRSLSAIDF